MGGRTMTSKAYRMAMLYDFYGQLLTERQRDFFDLHYNEDLSLSEIAEHFDITRQGVHDGLVRAEALLTEMEEKTGLVGRYEVLRERIAEIENAAAEILDLNRYGNDRITELAERIRSAAEQCKE